MPVRSAEIGQIAALIAEVERSRPPVEELQAGAIDELSRAEAFYRGEGAYP